MTTEGQEGQKGAEPKSRIEVLEEALYELIDKVEELAKAVATLQKTAVKKTTQRFGAEHARKAVKDTKTGKVYPSKFAAGKALAGEYNLDPLDTKVYYQVVKADPGRLVEATEEEAKGAWAEADAQLQKSIDEANRRIAEEEAKKAAEEKKAEEEAAKAAPRRK